MQDLARVGLELGRQRIDDLLFFPKMIMQVTGTDIDLVRDIVDGRARHPVFVEQEEAGDENSMTCVARHYEDSLPDTQSATHSAYGPKPCVKSNATMAGRS